MRTRPDRVKQLGGIGVDRMGSIADASATDFLRLENLDVDIPPDADAVLRTQRAAVTDADNSYLPFVGQRRLREVATRFEMLTTHLHLHVKQKSDTPCSV